MLEYDDINHAVCGLEWVGAEMEIRLSEFENKGKPVPHIDIDKVQGCEEAKEKYLFAKALADKYVKIEVPKTKEEIIADSKRKIQIVHEGAGIIWKLRDLVRHYHKKLREYEIRHQTANELMDQQRRTINDLETKITLLTPPRP
jgi:hypothetical protein